MTLDFTRCRDVWVPDDSEAGGRWSPPPPHVRFGVEQIVAHPFFLLADDMGLMKTAQTIIAAQFMHDLNLIDRVIVVAPAEVRSKVWFDEQLGQLREQVFEDKRNLISEFHTKVRQWSYGPKGAKELRWIVTNYEFIRNPDNLATLLQYCGRWTLLVLDESSAVRTYDSAQTEACMALRWSANKNGRPVLGVPRCGRILELNGTPIAETPKDMFSQGNLLHPSILDCKYVTHFNARYAVQQTIKNRGGQDMLAPYTKKVRQPDGSYKRVPVKLQQIVGWSDEGLKDIQQRFAPYVLRRESKSVGIDFALPPQGFDVGLTTDTWKLYRDMRDQMVAWLKSGVVSARQAGIKAIRLAQITSGFLSGVEAAGFDEDWLRRDDDNTVAYSELSSLIDSLQSESDYTLEDLANAESLPGARAVDKIEAVQEIGREKLDFTLQLHADLLKRFPDLKFLAWCRFVPELRRYLREERLAFPSIPVGAACGEKVFEGEHNKRDERDYAMKLLHPKTAPKGPATVGATQGTGALGLNFTSCRTVLDISYDASAWKKLQGDKRVNRTGQTGPVSFFYLVAVGPRGQKTIDHHTLLARLGKINVNSWTVSAWVHALQEE